MSKLKADVALMLVTLGWGISFILVKDLLLIVEAYNYLALRFLVAFLISGAIFWKNLRNADRNCWIYGTVLGLMMLVSFALQTVGLQYTTASKSAFVTGTNVVFVPIIVAWMQRKMPRPKLIASVMMAMAGMGLLTLEGPVSSINIGDVYTLLCAVTFAVYIVYVGVYAPKTDSIALAVIQMAVVGFGCLVISFMFETPTVPTAFGPWRDLLILSVMCTSGAFIVQNVAQKYTSASHVALIFTGEPVAAAMFAYLLRGEVLSSMGLLGATLIVVGMVIAELDFSFLLPRKRIATE